MAARQARVARMTGQEARRLAFAKRAELEREIDDSEALAAEKARMRQALAHLWDLAERAMQEACVYPTEMSKLRRES